MNRKIIDWIIKVVLILVLVLGVAAAAQLGDVNGDRKIFVFNADGNELSKCVESVESYLNRYYGKTTLNLLLCHCASVLTTT